MNDTPEAKPKNFTGTWNAGQRPAPVQEPVKLDVLAAFDAYARQLTYKNHKAEPKHFPNSYPWFEAGYKAASNTPPAAQRQWVGLTDEDRTEIRREHYARTLPLMDAVEAKLKEKNT
jgi:hypothetical protein